MSDDLMETPRCTAKSKQSGQRCKRRPIPGGTVCAIHGGNAPAVRAAADRRLQERQALLAVETLGLPREIDPHTALLEEVHRTAGAVAWLGAVVADLEQSDLVWGLTKEKTGGDDHGVTKEARPNAYVTLWQQERKHLVEVCKVAIAAGIEERRVELEQRRASMVAAAFGRALDRVALGEGQREVLAQALVEELRGMATIEAVRQ